MNVIIKTPIGLTEIQGDIYGISKIQVLDEETEVSIKIPVELNDAVKQLQEYFEGNRNQFSLKLNPKNFLFMPLVIRKFVFGSSLILIGFLALAKL